MKKIMRWLYLNIWHPFEFNILCLTADEKRESWSKAYKMFEEEVREFGSEVERLLGE